MELHELHPAPGSHKTRVRVGRGLGSGLGKLNSTAVQEDYTTIRGMIHKVRHLVKVEEVEA